MEYIDDNFPWIDGYKPNIDEIYDAEDIKLATLPETVYLDELPTKGWVGICPGECEEDDFDEFSPVLRNVTYDATSTYFIFLFTEDCIDFDTGEILFEVSEYIDDYFPWLDGYKPKMNEIYDA